MVPLPLRRVLAGPPSGGTPVTLPNGMRIRHWQKIETNFLYPEIFGADSVYAKGDFIEFRPGAVIVDAGANIGMFTLFAARQCRGEAQVFAFEPIPHDLLGARGERRRRQSGRLRRRDGRPPPARP